jgi:hypothetical protein
VTSQSGATVSADATGAAGARAADGGGELMEVAGADVWAAAQAAAVANAALSAAPATAGGMAGSGRNHGRRRGIRSGP